MEREKFSSRLGFILISAGCAIGLGNVWRFPYIVGQYGGAAFVLIYVAFLLLLGLPIIVMEFAVGRASQKSVALSFDVLEPKGSKWHIQKWFGMAGNYILMMFYTTVAGWLVYYFIKMAKGDFVSLDPAGVSEQFSSMMANPAINVGFMALVVVVCFGVCAMGLQGGVEKVTKIMMVVLLALMVVLACNSIMMENSGPGLEFYLKPDFGKIKEAGIGEVVFAALGQSFFTLSIGIGALAIFGSYIGKERRLTGEAVSVMILGHVCSFHGRTDHFPGLLCLRDRGGTGTIPDFRDAPQCIQQHGGRKILGKPVLRIYVLCGRLYGDRGVPEYRVLRHRLDRLFCQEGSCRQSGSDYSAFIAMCAGIQCVKRNYPLWTRLHHHGSGGLYCEQQPASVRQSGLPGVLYKPLRLGL